MAPIAPVDAATQKPVRARKWGSLSSLAGAQDGKFFGIVPDVRGVVDKSASPLRSASQSRP